MTHDPNVYGYVNGKPVFSRDEFIYESRRRGPIEDDAELIAFAKAADDARCWQLKETINWADNSVEEIYEDKDGNIKRITVIGPHGDAC